jgi:hypothetical protein
MLLYFGFAFIFLSITLGCPLTYPIGFLSIEGELYYIWMIYYIYSHVTVLVCFLVALDFVWDVAELSLEGSEFYINGIRNAIHFWEYFEDSLIRFSFGRMELFECINNER